MLEISVYEFLLELKYKKAIRKLREELLNEIRYRGFMRSIIMKRI